MFNKFAMKKDDIAFDRATDPANLSEEDMYALETSVLFNPDEVKSAVVQGDIDHKDESDEVSLAIAQMTDAEINKIEDEAPAAGDSELAVNIATEIEPSESEAVVPASKAD